MKKILKLLRQHLLEDFDRRFIITWLSFLALAIIWRYNIHNALIELITGQNLKLWRLPNHFYRYDYKILWEILLFAIPYFATVWLYTHFFGKKESWKQPGFWLVSSVILFVVYANHSLTFIYKDYWVVHLAPPIQYYVQKVCFNAFTATVYFLPAFIYWLAVKDYRQEKLYGFSTQDFDIKPYLFMLMIVFPLVVGASFFEAFLHTYPRYKFWQSGAEAYWGVPSWLTLGSYEFTYMAQFIFLEFFFRGFFVFALAKYLGKGSVYVMASVYCVIHFGKPMGECISSIFGGYILGVVALYTRSIYGGVMVHMGIAAMMELAASAQIFIFDKQPH